MLELVSRYARGKTRRREATTDLPQYIEPDAPRSRQPLTTCVATDRSEALGYSLAGRHARDAFVGYIRSSSTRLVLSQTDSRHFDTESPPRLTRSDLQPRPPAVCPMPPDTTTSRTNLIDSPPARPSALRGTSPRFNYRGCTVTAYDRCISL